MSNQTNESSVDHTSNLPVSGLGNLIKIASRKGKAHGESSNDLFEFATKNGFHSTHLLTSGNPAVQAYYADCEGWDAKAHDAQLREIQAMAIEGATTPAIAKHYVACNGSATKIKNILTTAQYKCFQEAWVNGSSPAKNECTGLRLRLETYERDQERLRIQKILENSELANPMDDLSEEDRLFIDPPRATDVVKTLATITKLVTKLKESEEPSGFTEGLTVGFFVKQFNESIAEVLRDRPNLKEDLKKEIGGKKK
tara:strand:- start:14 stop:778 length:765 start_codon:yes stop_codon:yes gene_type:complete